MSSELSQLQTQGWNAYQEQHLTKFFVFENWTRGLNFAQLVEIDSWSNDHHALLKLSSRPSPQGMRFVATVRWATYKAAPARIEQRDIDSAKRTDAYSMIAKSLGNVSSLQDHPVLQTTRLEDDVALLQSGWVHRDAVISKKFHFHTYTKCRDFVHVIGVECKAKNYHPDIVYFPCWVSIEWRLLVKEKAITLALFCDATASKIGTSANTAEGSHVCMENL
ncbi:hypothetical protein SMMN14_06063 [Sphaerulina musiva]